MLDTALLLAAAFVAGALNAVAGGGRVLVLRGLGFLGVAPGVGHGARPLAPLPGHIENDATAVLDALAEGARPGQPLIIPCARLIRIDFSAAGSVLNWAAAQQAQKREVHFQNLHRVVAVFFNVVGINEHAWVIPRKN